MAYDFPNSPSNGDTVTIQGVTYTFNSSDNAWATSVVSPPNPAIGISSGAPTLTSGISAASIKTLLGIPTDISNVVDGAPTALDTLNKIAAAINDDASFHTTVTAALAGKAPLASPAFTGAPTAPTAASGTNTTQVATTAFVQAALPNAGIALTDLSVVNQSASGSGTLAYNNTSGVFTFTPPSLAFSNISATPTTIAGYGITDAFSGAFSALTGKPTTISGYGITDAFDGVFASLSAKPTTISGYGITDAFSGAFSALTGKPTTVSGYGITDAYTTGAHLVPASNETYDLGSSTNRFRDLYLSGSSIVLGTGSDQVTLTANAGKLRSGSNDYLTKGENIDLGSYNLTTTGKLLFANMYSALSDLPSATTYHGMFAHVHATGGAYFAHGGNWIQLANKSYVDTQVSALVDSAPATLDTLNELAAALNDDANFATTVTNSLALKAPLASPALTGTPTAPTASANTNNTQIATTAYVDSAVSGASGTYSNTNVDSHLNTSTASSGEVLSWNGSDYDWVAQSSGGGGGGASVTTSDAAPSSPSAGDLWYNTNAGGLFVYYQDANSSQWVEVVGKTGATGPTNVSIGDAAPSSPSTGQFWWNSSANKLYIYYTDANSSQWVQATTPGAASTVAGPQGPTGPAGPAGAAAITRYANVAAFPASPTAADLAYANDTNTVYVYDGSSWDRISSGSDESPRVTTEPATEHSLNSDGTTSTVTMVAEDPEGFDIEYGIKYNTSGGALPDQLASATTINQSTGVFTFTPSTTNSDAGSFNARLTASDGNRVTVRTVPFTLAFYPQLANVVGRYEFFNTSSYNRSTSTTALNDISGNNRHITISNPGAYSSDGFLTHTAGSTSMNFGANSDQKSWAVIFRVPSGWTRSVTWDNNNADAVYYGALEDGNGGGGTPYSGYTTAWSGESIADYVNGTNPSGNRITAWNALSLGSTNSQITTGLQMANTNMHYHAYPNYAVTNEVYAIVFWDVVLTATEVEAVHNYYRGLLGNANMAAWST